MDVVGLPIGTARVARVLQNAPFRSDGQEDDPQLKESTTNDLKPLPEEDQSG